MSTEQACRDDREDRDDWLTKLWAEDNERDPLQHVALLRASGRTVTTEQGTRDYWRQQRRQRCSKNRRFRSPDIRHTTEPDTVVVEASRNVTLRDVQLRITRQQFDALFAVFALEQPLSSVASRMGMTTKQLRRNLGKALRRSVT